MKIATPLILKKITPLFPSNPPLKLRSCQTPSPSFLKILLEAQLPTPEMAGGWGGGMHTMMSIFHGTVSDVLGYQRVVAFLF